MGGRREPFTPEATVSPRMSVLECGCAFDGHREGGRRLSRQGPVRVLTEESAAQNQPACMWLKGQALACGGWAGVGYCLVTRGSSAKAEWGPVPGAAGALLPTSQVRGQQLARKAGGRRVRAAEGTVGAAHREATEEGCALQTRTRRSWSGPNGTPTLRSQGTPI